MGLKLLMGRLTQSYLHDGSEVFDESGTQSYRSDAQSLSVKAHRPPPPPSYWSPGVVSYPTKSGSRTLPDLISGAYSGQTQPLARWLLGLMNIIPTIWVGHPDDGSNGDGTCGGDECAGGAVNPARRSPVEGGDSEICGDGDGVIMARSLSTSASGGKDMEA
ncbi:hypothetical protein Tco_0374298 [Tanacetum coccineum]